MRCPSEQPGTWVTHFPVCSLRLLLLLLHLWTLWAARSAVHMSTGVTFGFAQMVPAIGDGAERDRTEGHMPAPIMLVQSDGLADQRRADVDLLAAPPDPAIGPDPPHDLVRAVVGFAQHAVKGA